MEKIAQLTQATADAISPLQIEIVRVSRIVAGLSLALGVIFFFVGQAIGLPFWSNFIFAIGIIVANVPKGLLPTVTLALAMGSQSMAKRHALIAPHRRFFEVAACCHDLKNARAAGPGWFGNPMEIAIVQLAGVAAEIALIALIVYTPWGNALLGSKPIALTVWLFIIPFALGMVALEELRKWFVRSHPSRPKF